MNKKSRYVRKIILATLFLSLSLGILTLIFARSWTSDLWIFAPHWQNLLGFKEEKNYLVVFQNNNELRPTGGFISTYGILKIKNGKLNLTVEDAYNLTNTEDLSAAPKPFEILMVEDSKFKGFYFRDGNFAVDFAKSAATLEKLYNEQSGKKQVKFDGVIAVNFEFLEDIIEIYKLKINDTELSRNNLFAILEHETKNIDIHNVEMLESRKSFLKDLSKALINEIISSIGKYDDFFAALNNALDEKKVILFFKDEKLQNISEEQKWAGSFDPSHYKNFIYSNIANIGGRKADRYIRKNHKYFVSFDQNGNGTVKYTINLEHLGTTNLNSDIYKAYLRVFVPSEAKFISAEGKFFDQRYGYVEGQYFEAYLKMEPGEERELNFTYTLPPEIKMQNFTLDLVKQPGTNDFWQVATQLPGDNGLVSKNFTMKENLSFWSGFLEQDEHFKFDYLKDKMPPLVLWQKFSEQNIIEIFFSENMDTASATNIKNYTIKDLNYINNQEDQITIKQIEADKHHITIRTEGITKAEEERYQITLKNIKDNFGNSTQPEEFTITAVQRL